MYWLYPILQKCFFLTQYLFFLTGCDTVQYGCIFSENKIKLFTIKPFHTRSKRASCIHFFATYWPIPNSLSIRNNWMQLHLNLMLFQSYIHEHHIRHAILNFIWQIVGSEVFSSVIHFVLYNFVRWFINIQKYNTYGMHCCRMQKPLQQW